MSNKIAISQSFFAVSKHLLIFDFICTAHTDKISPLELSNWLHMCHIICITLISTTKGVMKVVIQSIDDDDGDRLCFYNDTYFMSPNQN